MFACLHFYTFLPFFIPTKNSKLCLIIIVNVFILYANQFSKIRPDILFIVRFTVYRMININTDYPLSKLKIPEYKIYSASKFINWLLDSYTVLKYMGGLV